MKHYAHYGYKSFILALGYKGTMIKDYFFHYEIMNNDATLKLGNPEKTKIYQRHEENGWTVTLADRGKDTLKGGRLKKVEKYITGDEFMMTYGDGLADIDINALLAFHYNHGKLATVTGVNPVSRFGELKVKGSQAIAFYEKVQNDVGLISGGFFIFNKGIFNYLSSDDGCDLEIGALEQIARQGELMVYEHKGFWACMDTLRDMDYLNKLWQENQAPWKIWS